MPKSKKIVASLLNKYLSREFIATRSNGSSQFTYLEGHVAINLANKIFGFDGWSTKVKKIKKEFMDSKSDGKFSVGFSCICKVIVYVIDNNKTVKISKEDVGFGSCENMKNKLNAIENARKEAVTDSIKRCLRQFGTALGNCCYDKKYNIFLKTNSQKTHKVYGKLLKMEDLLSEEKEISSDNNEAHCNYTKPKHKTESCNTDSYLGDFDTQNG
ncbi:RAD52 [Ecytonucleospora hepatopenaei]|uniref:RAD52 n=1 Tax=Ecytonucleospora hepatopenaei TaxID=646526 RepID=A0A1W0E8I1_9MICR|nr:RAD52 [Ecytonucleospora hepatopenaei]